MKRGLTTPKALAASFALILLLTAFTRASHRVPRQRVVILAGLPTRILRHILPYLHTSYKKIGIDDVI